MTFKIELIHIIAEWKLQGFQTFWGRDNFKTKNIMYNESDKVRHSSLRHLRFIFQQIAGFTGQNESWEYQE